MASLRRKKTGLYYLTWTDKYRSPEQIVESLKTTEQARAKYLQRKLETDYHEGRHDPWVTKWYERHHSRDDKITLDEAKQEYIHEKSNTIWSYNTLRTVRGRLGLMAEAIGRNVAVSDIPQRKVADFIRSAPSPGTHKSMRTTVIAFLNWCAGKKYLVEVPKLPTVRIDEEIPEYLLDEELEALYKVKLESVEYAVKKGFTNPATTQHWMIDAWKLAVSTGMRKSEIINLKLQACSKDFITIGLHHQTKSRKQRRIPYLFEAKEVIDKYTDPDYRKSIPILAESDYLFGRKGETMAGRMSKEFSRCRNILWPERKEITFHSLRHTFAIRYLTAPAKGESADYRLYKLQRILGHASRTTTEVYLKAIPYDLQL